MTKLLPTLQERFSSVSAFFSVCSRVALVLLSTRSALFTSIERRRVEWHCGTTTCRQARWLISVPIFPRWVVRLFFHVLLYFRIFLYPVSIFFFSWPVRFFLKAFHVAGKISQEGWKRNGMQKLSQNQSRTGLQAQKIHQKPILQLALVTCKSTRIAKLHRSRETPCSCFVFWMKYSLSFVAKL